MSEHIITQNSISIETESDSIWITVGPCSVNITRYTASTERSMSGVSVRVYVNGHEDETELREANVWDEEVQEYLADEQAQLAEGEGE